MPFRVCMRLSSCFALAITFLNGIIIFVCRTACCCCICFIPVTFIGTLAALVPKELELEVFNFRLNIFSESTKKTYKVHIDTTYTRFCLFMCFPSVPATSFRIALYAAFIARTHKASSISQYLSTIGLLHKEYGVLNPLD